MYKKIPLLAEYVISSHLTTHVRPYENKTPVQNKVEGKLRLEHFKNTTHWRILLKLLVTGHNTDEVLCFDAACEMEAILDMEGIDEDERTLALTQTFPGLLTGSIRATLSSLSLQSGYGPLILPPISAAELPNFLVSE
ncbi:MAG: protein-export chaperone SecB [Agitococcus sp.]|nr:protein-export chaperone SecB [Agitococcus sp.]